MCRGYLAAQQPGRPRRAVLIAGHLQLLSGAMQDRSGACGDGAGCAIRCRAEAHQAVLEQARGALLGRVAGLPTPALLALLEASFPFVGIPELRGVPLAVSCAPGCD